MSRHDVASFADDHALEYPALLRSIDAWLDTKRIRFHHVGDTTING